MSDDILELDTDEEIREYKRLKFGELGFDATEVRLEAERQLAGLKAILQQTDDDLLFYRGQIKQALEQGQADKVAECRDYRRQAITLRKMVCVRIDKLQRVCANMKAVLQEVTMRGSDA